MAAHASCIRSHRLLEYESIITVICESDVTRYGRIYENSKMKIKRFITILRLQYAYNFFLHFPRFLFGFHTFQTAMQLQNPFLPLTWEMM